MGATLTQLSRTIDLSSQSGNPAALDPLLYSLEGVAASTATYTTLGGQSGISITNGADACLWLLTAVPLASFNTNSLAPAATLVIEWEQEVASSGNNGGVMFYHFSKGHFGSDGAGYLVDIFGGSAFLFSRVDNSSGVDGGYNTVTSASLPDSSAGYHRFRATLTANGDSTKNCLLEQFVSGSYETVFNATSVADMGSMFGVALFANATSNTLNLRGPNGANGPIVTYYGIEYVIAPVTQSEGTGAAVAESAINFDANVLTIGWQGQFLNPTSAPIWGTPGAAMGWSGMPAGYTGNTGSFWNQVMSGIRSKGKNSVIVHPGSMASGTPISSHAPNATRFDVTSYSGCHELLTTILAGDGRTLGQTVVIPVWDFTSDAIAGTTQSAWQTSFESIRTRCNALFPTTQMSMAICGDRTFWPGCTQAQNQAIRDANQAIISEGHAKLWFDDAVRSGAIGAGTDWIDVADANAHHPGTADNAAMAPLAVTGFFGAVGGSGGGLRGRTLPSVIGGKRLRGRDLP